MVFQGVSLPCLILIHDHETGEVGTSLKSAKFLRVKANVMKLSGLWFKTIANWFYPACPLSKGDDADELYSRMERASIVKALTRQLTTFDINHFSQICKIRL